MAHNIAGGVVKSGLAPKSRRWRKEEASWPINIAGEGGGTEKAWCFKEEGREWARWLKKVMGALAQYRRREGGGGRLARTS